MTAERKPTIRARLAPLEEKAKLFGRRRAHQLRIRRAARERREPPRGLVAVVSSPRCGGRLLVDYLDSVPDITFADEILHPGIAIGYRTWAHTKGMALRHVQRSLLALPSPICGAKFTFRQLDQHRLAVRDLVDLDPTPRFLILYRKSLGSTYVSLQAAQRRNEWLRRADSPPFTGSVHLDAAGYRTFAEQVRRDYEGLLTESWLKDRACLIAYEDLTAQPQEVFDELVFPVLGVPSFPVSTTLKKQIDRPMSEVVENYAEVRALLEGDQGRQDYAGWPHAEAR